VVSLSLRGREAEEPDRLRELSTLARSLAEALAAAAAADPRTGDAIARTRVGEPSEWMAEKVRGHLRARRARDELLGADLFADPAWDMLLDLFACHLEGRPVSVTDACIAACVPPTTALRWLARLEHGGVVVREADPGDRRRFYLRLAPSALLAIRRWATAHLGAG
jgi:hypothetical protein